MYDHVVRRRTALAAAAALAGQLGRAISCPKTELHGHGRVSVVYHIVPRSSFAPRLVHLSDRMDSSS
jgi:hypothetical protein